jgi:hypothetical protein
MSNVDRVIVYVKVEDKTVPEIFYDADKAKRFLESEENTNVEK